MTEIQKEEEKKLAIRRMLEKRFTRAVSTEKNYKMKIEYLNFHNDTDFILGGRIEAVKPPVIDEEIIKKAKLIVNPLMVKPPVIDEKIVEITKKWARVRSFATKSIRTTIGESLGFATLEDVSAVVISSFGVTPYQQTLLNSFRSTFFTRAPDDVTSNYSHRDIVKYLVLPSVLDFIYGRVSGFFNSEEWEGIEHAPDENPFQPAIDLWEMGLIPSFDGVIWRLHGGRHAKILWEQQLKIEK